VSQPPFERRRRDHAIVHAFDNPIRVEDLDEGLVMLIGPVIVHAMRARPQVPKVMLMPRTVAEILEQADELAARFEAHEGDAADVHDAAALHAVREAFQARAEAERELADAVGLARAEGHSWSAIGAMVGTSGEAARQRYGHATSKR
jgi:hypothetical protein